MGNTKNTALADLLASNSGSSDLIMAHERLLPLHPVLAPLFGLQSSTTNSGEVLRGLIRGYTVACVGSAAMSCALAILAPPTQAGSWAGVVGLSSVGVVAARDLGVALERTVFIVDPMSSGDTSEQYRDVAAVLSALVDGVDVLLLSHSLISALSPSLMRRLQTRVQSRGGVLIVVGETDSLSVDLRLTANTEQWQGIGHGHGYLQRRQVTLRLDGRRRGRPSQQQVWLPGYHGELAAFEPDTVVALRRMS